MCVCVCVCVCVYEGRLQVVSIIQKEELWLHIFVAAEHFYFLNN